MSAGEPVVVPDGELERGVGEVGQGHVVPAQGLFPTRTNGFTTNRSLLFARTVANR